MNKIKRRDIKKEQPTEYQVCLVFPHWIKAEWVDDRFYSSDGRESYYGVKTWIPVSELRNLMED
jgi:hypothetical protein